VAIQVEQAKLDLVESLAAQGLVTDPLSAKGRLLAKAAKLFRAKGYERTTVRDIAAEVGIQSGSIFHHFKSKDEILKAIMEEVIVYNMHRMRKLVDEADTARNALLALICCELDAVNGLTGNAMSVLVYEWRSLSEDKQRFILGLRAEYEALWSETMQYALDEADQAADVFVLRRLLTGALSWTTTWYDINGKLSINELAEEALKLVIKE
jgi:AcrR family transcriptional regulator